MWMPPAHHRIPSEDLDARNGRNLPPGWGMPMRSGKPDWREARRLLGCARPSPAMRPRWRGDKVLADAGAWIPGASARLINTSGVPRLCRSRRSRASLHANLGLAETCLNFDIANACLGFIDGMHMVGNLIEPARSNSA